MKKGKKVLKKRYDIYIFWGFGFYYFLINETEYSHCIKQQTKLNVSMKYFLGFMFFGFFGGKLCFIKELNIPIVLNNQ